MAINNDLLTAFIEASGFKVELVRDGDKRCDCQAGKRVQIPGEFRHRRPLSGCFICAGTGILPNYSYEVTKVEEERGDE